MSCKSLISAATTTGVSVLADGIVPLTTIVRRRGKELGLASNSVVIADCGSNFYTVTVTATFVAPAAGTATLKLQQNGVDVVGATASTTISTATTEVRSLSFTAIVRTFNNANIVDTLTIVNSGVAIALSNVDITVTQD